MRCIKTTVAAACATLALTAGAATAQTIPPDRTTYVTFSGPVSVPGTTLPAGTYTFRLLNSDTNRNVVQIFDREGMKLYTTLLAIPATRPEASGDPIITFKETPSDRPPAVRYWYYAGDTAGNELVYPKSQAILIANASGESVMSAEGTTIDDMKAGSMSRVSPSTTSSATTGTATTTGTSTSTSTTASTTTADTTTTAAQRPAAPPSSQTSTVTQTQTSQPTTTAPVTTTAPPTTAPVDQTAQPEVTPAAPPSTPDTVGTSGRTESLPSTASELPMVGLIGVFALVAALALRAARTAVN
jgi:hypothetical protein